MYVEKYEQRAISREIIGLKLGDVSCKMLLSLFSIFLSQKFLSSLLLFFVRFRYIISRVLLVQSKLFFTDTYFLNYFHMFFYFEKVKTARVTNFCGICRRKCFFKITKYDIVCLKKLQKTFFHYASRVLQ